MKKLSVSLQWLLIIRVVAGVLYARSSPSLTGLPAGFLDFLGGLFFLSYTGITKSEEPGYVPPARLRDQLRALKAAGYRTIKLADALAFLQGQGPLPEKALLLLFEGDPRTALRSPAGAGKVRLLGMFTSHQISPILGKYFLKEGDQKVCRHPTGY